MQCDLGCEHKNNKDIQVLRYESSSNQNSHGGTMGKYIVLLSAVCVLLVGCGYNSDQANKQFANNQKNVASNKPDDNKNEAGKQTTYKSKESPSIDSQKENTEFLPKTNAADLLETVTHTEKQTIDRKNIETFLSGITLLKTDVKTAYKKGIDWTYPLPNHQNHLCATNCVPKGDKGILLNKSQAKVTDDASQIYPEMPNETFGMASTGNIVIKHDFGNIIEAFNEQAQMLWSISNDKATDSGIDKSTYSSVYFVAKDGNIYIKSEKWVVSAKADTFDVNWAYNLESESLRGDKLSVFGDKLFANFKTGIVCMDAKTGNLLWKITDPNLDYGKYSFDALYHWCDDKYLYFVHKNNLYCADIHNGNLKWSVAYDGKFVVQGNALYMTTPDGLITIDGSTGFSKLLAKDVGGDVALVSQDSVFLARLPTRNNSLAEAELTCIGKSGKVLWARKILNLINEGSLMLQDSRLFVFTLDKIMLYNAIIGAKISDYHVFEKQNQIGMYYVCAFDGKFYVDNSFNIATNYQQFLMIGEKGK